MEINNSDYKESILRRTERGLLLYLRKFEEFGRPLERKNETEFHNTYNPFYEDTNPSFHIYFSEKANKWCHADYGNPDYKGDVFDFSANFFNHADFTTLLFLIDAELTTNLSYSNVEKQTNVPTTIRKANKNAKKKTDNVEVSTIEPSPKCIKYFEQYGIDLNNFPNVNQIYMIRYLNGDGTYESCDIIPNHENNIVIAYDIGKSYYKLKALEPKRHWYVGKKEGEYVFGSFDFAEYAEKPLFIVGGEKDKMVMKNLGFKAICLSSETAMPSQKLMKQIYECRYKPIILYDTDDAGRKGATQIHKKYNGLTKLADLSTIIPTNYISDVKDVADYIKHGLDKNKLMDFLNGFEPTEKILCEDGVEIQMENNNEIASQETAQLETIESKIETPQNSYSGFDSAFYNKLPNLLQQICKPIELSHEKDLVLLASLVVLSNVFSVHGFYNNVKTYPNLFLFITAQASAGKGVLRWVRRLMAKVDEDLYQKYRLEMEDYNELTNKEKETEYKPQRKSYFIGGNSSLSAMIQQLSNNDGFGVILESEADTLNVAMKNDWGNYSEVLRKAFEFENISMMRRDSENCFEIHNPNLSIAITGTPNQLLEFIPSTENGLFSRFMFMQFPLVKVWKNVFDSSEIDFEEYYDSIGEELSKVYKNRSKRSIQVKLSKSQMERFHNTFSRYQNQFDGLLGEDSIASIRRIGNMHFRICILLTALRENDYYQTIKGVSKEKLLECSNEDFENANTIVIYLLKNLQTIYGYLPSASQATKNLSRKQTLLYEVLSIEFNYSEFQREAKKLDIATSTAESHLRRFIKHNLVEKVEHGKYSKTKL